MHQGRSFDPVPELIGRVRAELSESFYVGDAAGRKHDFADSDKCAHRSTCETLQSTEDINFCQYLPASLRHANMVSAVLCAPGR